MNKERRRQNYSSFTKRNGYKFGVPLETDKIGVTIADLLPGIKEERKKISADKSKQEYYDYIDYIRENDLISVNVLHSIPIKNLRKMMDKYHISHIDTYTKVQPIYSIYSSWKPRITKFYLRIRNDFPWDYERLIWIYSNKSDGPFSLIPTDVIKIIIQLVNSMPIIGSSKKFYCTKFVGKLQDIMLTQEEKHLEPFSDKIYMWPHKNGVAETMSNVDYVSRVENQTKMIF